MKVLHVFTDQNYVYVEALIKLFYSNFPNVKNDFLICSKKETVPQSIVDIDFQNRISYLQGSKRFQTVTIKKLGSKHDYIVFHFLPNDILLHLYYYFNNEGLKRVVWRIWGADLYNWKKESPKFIVCLLNFFRENTRKRIRYIIPEPMDIDEYVRQFGNSAMILYGPDPKGYDSRFLENNKRINSDGIFRIIIGHSAVKFVNHIEILNTLKKYKNENIKIVLPLNYGDPEYGDYVSDQAIKEFGEDKVEIIRNKLNLADYVRLMWGCDALIIHSDRQIAMGNITMMLYMGKKVYIKYSSVMGKYYYDQEKLTVFDSNSISELSFNELSSPIDDISRNKEYAINEIEIPNIVNKWNVVFKNLEDEL